MHSWTRFNGTELVFWQDLQRRLSECQNVISSQSEDGSRLSSLIGDGANKVKDLVDQGSQMINVLNEKVKAEAERVKLQRHKSLEVLIASFNSSYVICLCAKLDQILDDKYFLLFSPNTI